MTAQINTCSVSYILARTFDSVQVNIERLNGESACGDALDTDLHILVLDQFLLRLR
jgi:hypothetical protein